MSHNNPAYCLLNISAEHNQECELLEPSLYKIKHLTLSARVNVDAIFKNRHDEVVFVLRTSPETPTVSSPSFIDGVDGLKVVFVTNLPNETVPVFVAVNQI